MRKKELLIWIVFFYIIFLILAMVLLNIITYQREVAIIIINDTKIQEVQFGFQTITIMQGLSNSLPKGNLRLNYGVKDNNLDEIIYIGQEDSIGEGSILLNNFKFPLDNSWEIRIELKDMDNFIQLDKKCYTIKFEVINGGKQISQENCNY